jgi:hypothetical protein
LLLDNNNYQLKFKQYLQIIVCTKPAEKKDCSLMRTHIRQTTKDLTWLHIGDVSMDILMDNLEPLLNNLDDFEKRATDEGAVFLRFPLI